MLIQGRQDAIRQWIDDRAKPVDEDLYRFLQDRQGWHLINIKDTGWPMKDVWRIVPGKEEPLLIGPLGHWNADGIPWLVMEAAFRTRETRGHVFWSRHDLPGFAESRSLTFLLTEDSAFRVNSICLADSKAYQGFISQVRIAPVARAEEGDWIMIRSLQLTAKP